MKRILNGTTRVLEGLLEISMAIFATTALVGGCVGLGASAYDPTRLWLGAPGFPVAARAAVLLGFGLAYLLPRIQGRGPRPMTGLVAWLSAGALGVLCLLDAIAVAQLGREGAVFLGAPLSLSAVVTLVFAVWLARPWWRTRWTEEVTERPRVLRTWPRRLALLAAVGCMAAGWIGLHLATFGASDYRRPADAIIVLGAAVRPDGSASPALRDRVVTACDLYREGLASHLVLSGGHTPGRPVSEAACMRELALTEGVPAMALILDEAGWTTEATVRNTKRITQEHGWERVLFVSHDYHLARIKLRAERHGLQAVTVPAEETVVWRAKPLAFVREIVAFGWNVVRP